MKVKVEITLDVDIESWMLNYGVDRNEVREDVKLYFAKRMKAAYANVQAVVMEIDSLNAEIADLTEDAATLICVRCGCDTKVTAVSMCLPCWRVVRG